MVSGTLYTYPDNFRAYKALIAAQYAKADVKVAKDFVFGETNNTKEFLKKFPSGNVPAFESSEGHCLTDGNAIAYYIGHEKLMGKCELQKAEILQWIGFADAEILPPTCTWVFPVLGIMSFDGQKNKRAQKDIKKAIGFLNNHLNTRTYLVGERISLADIVNVCTLLPLYKHVFDNSHRKGFQNVNRWFTTIINQPEVKAVIGEFKICEKEEQWNPAKYAEFQGKHERKESESTEQKKPAVVEEKPKEEKEPEGEAKEKFVMDDFKRVYSNESETKSIPYFWEKFDPENYSIWFSEYKYNDELQKVFMSCNLITGMFQRLDKMRKVAFSSVCLFGKDSDSTISGVWVWKGHDLIFEQSPDWQIDYESYDWKKLDPSSEETKKLVNEYFAWTAKDKNGREFNQGKIFK